MFIPNIDLPSAARLAPQRVVFLLQPDPGGRGESGQVDPMLTALHGHKKIPASTKPAGMFMSRCRGLQRLEHRPRCFHRAVDVVLAVCGAHEAGFVQRRGEVFAALEHAVVELVEAGLVGGHHLRVVGG